MGAGLGFNSGGDGNITVFKFAKAIVLLIFASWSVNRGGDLAAKFV
jgi:hypothetical protein